MMKILTLISLVALSATSASALTINEKLETNSVENNVSYYDTLGELFAKGTLPKLASISNIAWSGRCFTHDQPSEPINAGYMFRKTKTPTSDVGPIAGTRTVSYEATSYWSRGSAPSYYDEMSVKQVMDSQKVTFFPVLINNSSIQISMTNGQEIIASSLRMSGEYLVEELLNNMNQGIRCYYFIPKLQTK